MERAVGIGGVFLRSADPDALARWYADNLGINAMSSETEETWWQAEGPTVWAPFSGRDRLLRPARAGLDD